MALSALGSDAISVTTVPRRFDIGFTQITTHFPQPPIQCFPTPATLSETQLHEATSPHRMIGPRSATGPAAPKTLAITEPTGGMDTNRQLHDGGVTIKITALHP